MVAGIRPTRSASGYFHRFGSAGGGEGLARRFRLFRAFRDGWAVEGMGGSRVRSRWGLCRAPLILRQWRGHSQGCRGAIGFGCPAGGKRGPSCRSPSTPNSSPSVFVHPRTGWRKSVVERVERGSVKSLRWAMNGWPRFGAGRGVVPVTSCSQARGQKSRGSGPNGGPARTGGDVARNGDTARKNACATKRRA